MVAIKICGVTRIEDVRACVALGVDAIGLNLWPRSPRSVSLETARALVDEVAGAARVVLVMVEPSVDDLEAARRATGASWSQIHGVATEPVVRATLPSVMRAVSLGDERDVEAAVRAPGIEVLVDAKVAGLEGGTGVLAPFALAAEVARRRPTWLAGGLRATNVAAAIARVRPLGVDVASGVESAPGVKDAALLAAFVTVVREQRWP